MAQILLCAEIFVTLARENIVRRVNLITNIKLYFAAMLAFVSLSMHAQSQNSYYTHPVVDEVKTIRTVVDGDFMRLPVIDNTDNSTLEISFDYLANEEPYLEYRIVHCDAQWHPDDLSELDYLDGFLPVKVASAKPSFNTFTNYYHYSVNFPNDDVRLLVSGNYAVIFYEEGDSDTPLAEATFSVTEQLAFVAGEVSASTDIDYLQQHQQLTLQCSWSQPKLPYLDPAHDLQLVVTQNHRTDTRRTLSVPSRMEAGKAFYEHQHPLIFEAGNTYRRFEFTDHRFAALGVEKVRYQAPVYHVSLVSDLSRAGGFYRYDQDQHGRYLVRSLRVDDVDTESEYFVAEFTLNDAMPSKGRGGIYLSGDFTYGLTTDAYQMHYDLERKCYVAEVLLKQGHYNYQYLVKDATGKFSSGVVEGNYYETQNQYEVYVYYRPMGARYDRLLGVAQFVSK